MIVQRKKLDLQSVKAGRVVMATPQGFFALLSSSPFHNKKQKSTVNFGDQSPRKHATATAKTVHDKTAGEQIRLRQRISHHWRGIDLTFLSAQNLENQMYSLGKKLYISTLKYYQLKIFAVTC